MAVFSARWQMWEEEFSLSNGHDAVSVGNADRRWWCIVVAGGHWGSAMAVVMAHSSVGNGSEIGVVMECGWRWATGCISGINNTIIKTSN